MNDSAFAESTPCPFCGHRKAQRNHSVQSIGKRWYLARCTSCGLHRTDPCPTPDDLDRMYSGTCHGDLRVSGGASERAFQRKYDRYHQLLKPYAHPR